MSGYRKKRNGDTWHFRRNCSEWPAADYEEQSAPPMFGELCNECQAKRLAGDCG